MLPHCTINGREIKFITAGKRFHDQKPLTEINLLGYGIIHPRVNIEELILLIESFVMKALGTPAKKNWIFYDIELFSIATYPPYLIMT